MTRIINYPELKTYMLKLYQMFEQVSDYYLRNTNICENPPLLATEFISLLVEIRTAWERILDEYLANVVAAELDLNQLEIDFKNDLHRFSFLEKHIQPCVISKYLLYSNTGNFDMFYEIRNKLVQCGALENRIIDYMNKKPVKDEVEQISKIKLLYNLNLDEKFKPTPVTIETIEYTHTDDGDSGCLLGIVIGVCIVGCLPIAYLWATIFVSDTSNEFSSWFIGSYIVSLLIFIPAFYFTEKKQDEYDSYPSGSSSYRSKGRGKSRLSGWKIKQYDPSGWRKKNGTNLFKSSGRRSKWGF